jgi:hypothetical protein
MAQGSTSKYHCQIVFYIAIYLLGQLNGRGVEISVECDAWQQVAAVAEPLSSVAAGDLFGTEGRYGAGARFLEFVLEREEPVFEVSAVDARDEGLLRFFQAIVAGPIGFSLILSIFGLTVQSCEIVLLLFDNRRMQSNSRTRYDGEHERLD